MSSERFCQICNSPVSDDDAVCPYCKEELPGATQSFNPVPLQDKLVTTADVAPSAKEAHYMLLVTKGPQAGGEFYLDRPKVTIGRDPRCNIFLNDMTVSREHAVIQIADNVATVTDVNSLNGTWLNNKLIETATLSDKSVLQIGTFTMEFKAY